MTICKSDRKLNLLSRPLKAPLNILVVFVLSIAIFSTCYGGINITDIKLGLAFQAKEACSCLYIEGNSEKFCRDYVHLKQVSSVLKVDPKTKTVHTQFLGIVEHAAKFHPKKGCQHIQF